MSTLVDAKETSNDQCESRRLEARQFILNACTGSRVQMTRGSREQLSAATDAAASNIRCDQRSSTQQLMDFTTRRNNGYAFLNFFVLPCHALRIRCPEESGANRRHRRSRGMETAGESTRSRHEWTSRVTALAQRGMKNNVILNRLVTHASCLNTRWFVKSCDIVLTRVSLAAHHSRGTSELCQGQRQAQIGKGQEGRGRRPGKGSKLRGKGE